MFLKTKAEGLPIMILRVTLCCARAHTHTHTYALRVVHLRRNTASIVSSMRGRVTVSIVSVPESIAVGLEFCCKVLAKSLSNLSVHK